MTPIVIFKALRRILKHPEARQVVDVEGQVVDVQTGEIAQYSLRDLAFSMVLSKDVVISWYPPFHVLFWVLNVGRSKKPLSESKQVPGNSHD